MIARVPAPDGRKDRDGQPILVLPEGTILKECYKVSYYTIGGMSVVYRGEREGKSFLLKEVRAGDSQRVISLTQEKSMLDRFECPGIVEIHDFFEQDGYYYMVLEFIEGKSLDKLVSRKAGAFLDEALVTEWAMQLYDIFEYLHSQNPPVIYRDLKPQNVILDSSGRLKLVDFGIARVFKGGKAEDTFSMGSAITASPEHYGGKQTDARSDIFTLGATLHYLCTNGQGSVEGLFGFVPIRLLNKNYSEGLEGLIIKALDLDPEKRFQTMDEMRKAHRAVSEGKPPGEAEPAPAEAREAGATATPPVQAAASASPGGQRIFVICAALLLVLLGTFLGLRLSKTAGGGGAVLSSPSQALSGTVAAIVSPQPSSESGGEHTPQAAPTAPAESPEITASPSKAAPVTPHPSKSAARRPRPSGTPVAHRPPPPLPGTRPEPPDHVRRPPPPDGHPPGEGEWISSSEHGFRVHIPGGYEKMSRDKQNVLFFQRTDKDEGLQSMRFVEVMVVPLGGNMEEYTRRHFQKLKSKGASFGNRRLLRDKGGLEITYTKPLREGGRDFSCKERIIKGNDGSRVFCLIAGAAEGDYEKYEGEFEDFFRSFRQE
jgi:serine/threonine protein kinase